MKMTEKYRDLAITNYALHHVSNMKLGLLIEYVNDADKVDIVEWEKECREMQGMWFNSGKKICEKLLQSRRQTNGLE